MFLAEARLAAMLQHQHIGQVYDIGIERGSYFFAMEYIHGADVGRIIASTIASGKPLPVECAVTIVSAAAAGLHHAHEKHGPDGAPLDLVHRDVSPQNILVSFDGSVKVVDFGIAKAATNNGQTKTGSLKGKLSYMSPEQCQSLVLDRRSDVFSLGVILWELVTGRRLHDSENEYAVIRDIVEKDTPPPSSVRADCPEALDVVAICALARNPINRYQTARELQEALDDFAHDARLRVGAGPLARQMEQMFGTKLDEYNRATEKGAFFVEDVVLKTLSGVATTVMPDLHSRIDDEPTSVQPIVLPGVPEPATTPNGPAPIKWATPVPMFTPDPHAPPPVAAPPAAATMPTTVVATPPPMAAPPIGVPIVAPASFVPAPMPASFEPAPERAPSRRWRVWLATAAVAVIGGIVILTIASKGDDPPAVVDEPEPAAVEAPTPPTPAPAVTPTPEPEPEPDPAPVKVAAPTEKKKVSRTKRKSTSRKKDKSWNDRSMLLPDKQ
jgi:serine/threonine-protein kinase